MAASRDAAIFFVYFVFETKYCEFYFVFETKCCEFYFVFETKYCKLLV